MARIHVSKLLQYTLAVECSSYCLCRDHTRQLGYTERLLPAIRREGEHGGQQHDGQDQTVSVRWASACSVRTSADLDLDQRHPGHAEPERSVSHKHSGLRVGL